MHDYRKLKAWQAARVVVREIYTETATFPRSEQYGLVAQGAGGRRQRPLKRR